MIFSRLLFVLTTLVNTDNSDTHAHSLYGGSKFAGACICRMPRAPSAQSGPSAVPTVPPGARCLAETHRARVPRAAGTHSQHVPLHPCARSPKPARRSRPPLLLPVQVAQGRRCCGRRLSTGTLRTSDCTGSALAAEQVRVRAGNRDSHFARCSRTCVSQCSLPSERACLS